MPDGSPSPESKDDPSEEWRDQEAVDEQYREPTEPGAGDIGPDVPEVPDPSENSVDPELQRRFWALVLVFNVALLALSLGAMFVVFEGKYSLGGQLFLGGLLAFGFGLYRYRTTKRRLGELTGGESAPDGAGTDDEDAVDEQNG